jgi:hypothetical protein
MMGATRRCKCSTSLHQKSRCNMVALSAFNQACSQIKKAPKFTVNQLLSRHSTFVSKQKRDAAARFAELRSRVQDALPAVQSADAFDTYLDQSFAASATATPAVAPSSPKKGLLLLSLLSYSSVGAGFFLSHECKTRIEEWGGDQARAHSIVSLFQLEFQPFSTLPCFSACRIRRDGMKSVQIHF